MPMEHELYENLESSRAKIPAAAYIRVSGPDQVDRWSLDGQRRMIEDYCKQKGFHLVEVYCDPGHSAYRNKASIRPAYNRMLADAALKKFRVVISVSIDRMSRDMLDMLTTFKTLDALDIEYASVTEDIDLTGPMGKAFLTIIATFAEMYSDSVSRHTKRGQAQRTLNGLPLGKPPFGYQLCDDRCPEDGLHRYCHINSDKAILVKAVYERYAQGGNSFQQIADWVNAMGYRTNGLQADRRGIESSGGRFTEDAISRMLRNKFYIGQISHQGEFRLGVHESIIDQSLFDRVQKTLAKNTSRKSSSTRGRKPKSGHLLAKLARCFQCGAAFQSTTQGKNNKVTHYRMDARATGELCHFANRSRVGRHFDETVKALFENMALRDDWKDFVMQEYIQNADIGASERRRTELEERRRRVIRLYKSLDISDSEYDSELSRIEAELMTLVVPGIDEFTRAGELLEDFGNLFRAANTMEKNELLLSVLDAVYLDPDNRAVHSIQPKPAFAGPIRAMAERVDLRLQEVPQFPFCREIHDSSPRMRGNPLRGAMWDSIIRSIPAHAGQPIRFFLSASL